MPLLAAAPELAGRKRGRSLDFSDTENGKLEYGARAPHFAIPPVFSRSDRRMIERRHPTRARHHVDQQVLSFAVEFRREKTNTCGVAARPREQRNQACPDHIIAMSGIVRVSCW